MTFPPELLRCLVAAQRVTVLTGAGVSTESGVPTFRDAQSGLWAKFKPEQLATPTAFRREPRLVWEWYAWRRELVAKANPNPAHTALVEWEKRLSSFTLITQNVDDLHRRAGSHNIIELHGNITRTKCFDENVVVKEWPDTTEIPPHCPRCGAFLRPDVVWFGEAMPEVETSRAFAASAQCDVFLSIGTSAVVYPAASLPFHALEHGATVIEINPDPTPLTDKADYVLTGPAGVILPELMSALG
jgi:NAD-dependent deacetylase